MKLFNYQTMGKGPDLILLHGFAMNSIFLKPFAEQLGQHFRVHLFDLPGFGKAYQTTMQEHPELPSNALKQDYFKTLLRFLNLQMTYHSTHTNPGALAQNPQKTPRPQLQNSKNIQIFTISEGEHLPFISHEKICLSIIESFLNEPIFNLSKITNRPFLQQSGQYL